MPERSSSEDINEIATRIVAQTTGMRVLAQTNGKNPAAVMLGRLGGKKGGPARAKALSAKKRKAIAQKAAKARWKNKS